jgi:hypothetical protein
MGQQRSTYKRRAKHADAKSHNTIDESKDNKDKDERHETDTE